MGIATPWDGLGGLAVADPAVRFSVTEGDGAPRVATPPLAARADGAWVSHTPQAAHALSVARQLVLGDDGPFASAIVGVYGAGKTTLLFALLREAAAAGHAVVWEEASALIARLLPVGEEVTPQELAGRVVGWLRQSADNDGARRAYLDGLAQRGREDVVAALAVTAPRPGARLVLLLDEVEQAHVAIARRVASDDGQPLRALIDACGPGLRLVLAYAPESYHSLGDADRGRLYRLALPALDVASIQRSHHLSRGEANFAWWVSRGRARGVVQAVDTVLTPLRSGHFEADLGALGDALDALPGVFGVPALLREGMSHQRLRALLDLRPQPSDALTGGVTCSLRDRRALADRIRGELTLRVGAVPGLEAVANEVVGVLEACADEEEQAYLTVDDFVAVVRLAEARVIEAGRLAEPIPGLCDHAARVFDCLGTLGPLARRLPVGLRELGEERFPSPFTDPSLPLGDGRVPSDAELQRAFAPLAAQPGPLWVGGAPDFAVFADGEQLAAFVERGAAGGAFEPTRALLLDGSRPVAPIVELAIAAGRLATATIGRFHTTFLRCLALRSATTSSGDVIDLRRLSCPEDRQLERKIAWHRDRVTSLAKELQPRTDPAWAAASAYLRQFEPFRGTLGRLDRESPAQLGLLLPLRPPSAAGRAAAIRIATLCGEGTPLRRLAREANPGGRLSGAAVVIDALLPAGTKQPRWTEVEHPGARALAQVFDRFGRDPALHGPLAAWLFVEDRARISGLVRWYAGALPDVHRERDALAALRLLDDTARRAATVVADLERCTGRRQGGHGALRLGSFVDQLRQQAGPVDALRHLAADVEALPDDGTMEWLRALLLWLVGVFAARLLQGVERDQVALGDWQRLASIGSDVGKRADAVGEAARHLGADRICELLQHRRARLGNMLDDRHAAAHALEELAVWVDALAPLLGTMAESAELLEGRGVAFAPLVSDYLPPLDSIPGHAQQLSRLGGYLADIDTPLPRATATDLMAFLEALRCRADASRREGARLRVEDRLGIALPPTLDVSPEDEEGVLAAYQAVPEADRRGLRLAIEGSALESGGALARAIAAWAEKRSLLAAWGAVASEAFAAIDAAVAPVCLELSSSLDEVRSQGRERARALAALLELEGCGADSAALEALVAAAAAATFPPTYTDVAEHARVAAERLSSARERYARIAGTFPRGVAVAGDIEATICAIDAAALALQLELEAAVAALRRLGGALIAHGEQATSIPPSLSLAAAMRLVERDRLRLGEAVARRRAALAAEVAAAGLPASLVPAGANDALEDHEALQASAARWGTLAGTIATAAELGLGLIVEAGAGWEEVARDVTAQVEGSLRMRAALHQRQERLRARCRRLAGPSLDNPINSMPLADAQRLVAESQRLVEELREARLGSASAAARALYRSIAAGDAAALPSALAELLELGVLRTVEAEP